MCPICSSSNFKIRPGKIRTTNIIKASKVLECNSCGFVFLDDTSHISNLHYQESRMFESDKQEVDLAKYRQETKVDDVRRFEFLKAQITGKEVLEVGSGNSSFLLLAQTKAARVVGIEPDRQFQDQFRKERLDIHADIESLDSQFDVVCTFHVIEHVKDVRKFVESLIGKTRRGGKIYIETPNSDDALITLYESREFMDFTYWDNHLGLLNHQSMQFLLDDLYGIEYKSHYVQRYGIGNHLHWLAKKAGGGHLKWNFLENSETTQGYQKSLGEQGKNDTLFYEITKLI